MRKVFGFTLVEILVVVSVLAILGTFFVVIFTRTLRGSNKSQIILAIKQNGQSVLETMDKSLRYASRIICISSTPNNTIVLKKSDGTYQRYRFIPPRASGAPSNECMSAGETISAASNGCVVSDNPTPDPLTEEDVTVFIDRVCHPGDPMPGASILTDTNRKTGVSLLSGGFTIDRQGGEKDIITFTFSLHAGLEAPSVIAGEVDPISYRTSVELR